MAAAFFLFLVSVLAKVFGQSLRSSQIGTVAISPALAAAVDIVCFAVDSLPWFEAMRAQLLLALVARSCV